MAQSNQMALERSFLMKNKLLAEQGKDVGQKRLRVAEVNKYTVNI